MATLTHCSFGPTADLFIYACQLCWGLGNMRFTAASCSKLRYPWQAPARTHALTPSVLQGWELPLMVEHAKEVRGTLFFHKTDTETDTDAECFTITVQCRSSVAYISLVACTRLFTPCCLPCLCHDMCRPGVLMTRTQHIMTHVLTTRVHPSTRSAARAPLLCAQHSHGTLGALHHAA